MSLVRHSGSIAALSAAERRTMLERTAMGATEVRTSVAATIDRVRDLGDRALRESMREHHDVDLASLEVPRGCRQAALVRLDPALRRAMERAAANIAITHRATL